MITLSNLKCLSESSTYSDDKYEGIDIADAIDTLDESVIIADINEGVGHDIWEGIKSIFKRIVDFIVSIFTKLKNLVSRIFNRGGGSSVGSPEVKKQIASIPDNAKPKAPSNSDNSKSAASDSAEKPDKEEKPATNTEKSSSNVEDTAPAKGRSYGIINGRKFVAKTGKFHVKNETISGQCDFPDISHIDIYCSVSGIAAVYESAAKKAGVDIDKPTIITAIRTGINNITESWKAGFRDHVGKSFDDAYNEVTDAAKAVTEASDKIFSWFTETGNSNPDEVLKTFGAKIIHIDYNWKTGADFKASYNKIMSMLDQKAMEKSMHAFEEVVKEFEKMQNDANKAIDTFQKDMKEPGQSSPNDKAALAGLKAVASAVSTLSKFCGIIMALVGSLFIAASSLIANIEKCRVLFPASFVAAKKAEREKMGINDDDNKSEDDKGVIHHNDYYKLRHPRLAKH